MAGYRDKRESDLTALAQRIGAKVRRTGRSFAMEPMNPYERRIIHSAIGKMEGVRSESKGEGRDRRVVIYSTAPDAQTENTYGERRPRGGRGNGRRPGGSRNGGYRGGNRSEHGDHNGNRGGYRGSRNGAPRGPRPSSVPLKTEPLPELPVLTARAPPLLFKVPWPLIPATVLPVVEPRSSVPVESPFFTRSSSTPPWREAVPERASVS